jgi:hypothetical protein
MTPEFADGLYTGIVVALLVIGWSFLACWFLQADQSPVSHTNITSDCRETTYETVSERNHDSLQSDLYSGCDFRSKPTTCV